jgi:hypothetical protein
LAVQLSRSEIREKPWNEFWRNYRCAHDMMTLTE